MGKYFEDFGVGQETLTAGRTITEADIVNFAGITGDWNEIHTNREMAERGPFGQRIAHGALVFSISTGLSVRLGLTYRRCERKPPASAERMNFAWLSALDGYENND